MSPSPLSPQRRVVTAGFAACLAAGVATMAFGSGATTAVDRPTEKATAAALPASPPAGITIDRLGVAAKVVELRAAADGTTLALPPLRQAGWDTTSVTPGQTGITVITGYISRTAEQPGVLRPLGRLHTGDVVTVRRRDGRHVDYRVRAIDYYARGTFPAAKVFPRTTRPELRLISTGGPLHAGDPLGNAVVTAVAR